MAQSPGFSHRSQMWDATGMWAWILHRITGLGLVFYILLHTILMGVSLLSGKEGFDATLSILMGHPVFELLDTMLLGAVLYHGFNGIRILLFDMGIGISVKRQKSIFGIFMGVAAILWFWSIVLKFSE
ncbi:MAG: succinate dehydrogenase, cytochrome b556 subunit [Proteobacteria bacterium]|nr:succinate dehydrogenase, cytochrome b556 subunit [Pseudomonadota bacterium]MBU0989330.1 succinate dehydrogenase, cytochrome b556 subunit [Pseudomonadota bacterium]MBU1903802.1 succinate dehydrogenase, cytochrome b556 subunit [Pseudomonadota bacterium]